MKTNLRLIGGKKLQSPNNSYTRPTTLRVREAIFNILNKASLTLKVVGLVNMLFGLWSLLPPINLKLVFICY